MWLVNNSYVDSDCVVTSLVGWTQYAHGPVSEERKKRLRLQFKVDDKFASLFIIHCFTTTMTVGEKVLSLLYIPSYVCACYTVRGMDARWQTLTFPYRFCDICILFPLRNPTPYHSMNKQIKEEEEEKVILVPNPAGPWTPCIPTCGI